MWCMLKNPVLNILRISFVYIIFKLDFVYLKKIKEKVILHESPPIIRCVDTSNFQNLIVFVYCYTSLSLGRVVYMLFKALPDVMHTSKRDGRELRLLFKMDCYKV